MSAAANEADLHWTDYFFRPSHAAVTRWLSNFYTRHFVLTIIPCLIVWVWVAMPFPVEDPYRGKPKWSYPGDQHRLGECRSCEGRKDL